MAALTLAFAAPSYAQVTGTNSAVQDNFQSIEQFRAKWNNLLDRAKGRTDIQHSCQDGALFAIVLLRFVLKVF